MRESLAIDCTGSDTMMNYELYAYRVISNSIIENLLREILTALSCFHLENPMKQYLHTAIYVHSSTANANTPSYQTT